MLLNIFQCSIVSKTCCMMKCNVIHSSVTRKNCTNRFKQPNYSKSASIATDIKVIKYSYVASRYLCSSPDCLTEELFQRFCAICENYGISSYPEGNAADLTFWPVVVLIRKITAFFQIKESMTFSTASFHLCEKLHVMREKATYNVIAVTLAFGLPSV